MGHIVILVCTFTLLQGAWSVPTPQTTEGAAASTGTGSDTGASVSVSRDFKTDVGTMVGNLHGGAQAFARPLLSFGYKTVPSLFRTGYKTATEKIGKIAQAKVNAAGEVAKGVSAALGSAGVLGSSVVGSGLKVVGHGLGAVVTGLGAGAELGINLGGKLGDHVASGITAGGKHANGALGALGDGMTAVSGGMGVLAHGGANVLDAIGNRLTLAITNAQKVASDLMDSGAMKMETGAVNLFNGAQVNFYEILNCFLQIIQSSQSMLDKFTTTISSAGTAAAATKGLGASGKRSLDLDRSVGAGLSFNAGRSMESSIGGKRSIGGEVSFGVGGGKSLGLSGKGLLDIDAKSSVGLGSLDLDSNGSFKLGTSMGLGGKASLEFGHEKSAGAGGKGSIGLKVNSPFGIGGELSIGDSSASKAEMTASHQ